MPSACRRSSMRVGMRAPRRSSIPSDTRGYGFNDFLRFRLRPRRTPADQLVRPLEPSGYGAIRQARHFQTETYGKPGEVLAASQCQRLCLSACKDEQTGRISAATIGQSSEQRERLRNHLSEELQIARRDATIPHREDDGIKEHGPERKLLHPVRF